MKTREEIIKLLKDERFVGYSVIPNSELSCEECPAYDICSVYTCRRTLEKWIEDVDKNCTTCKDNELCHIQDFVLRECCNEDKVKTGEFGCNLWERCGSWIINGLNGAG